MGWFTRKNPYYTFILAAIQMAFGIYFLLENRTVEGGFFMWASGANCAWLIGSPPDHP